MNAKTFYNLSNKILIASPYTLYGNIFYKSVIYVISHSIDGSIGLIINRPIKPTQLKSMFRNMDTKTIDENVTMPIYIGGPVEVERGFVLHSDDYQKDILLNFQNHLAVSSNPNIIKDIVEGKGPKDSLFIVGYTSWEPGQMEEEIANNLWIVADYDKDLIFSLKDKNKWEIALQRLGIDDTHFSNTLGHG